VGRVRHVFGEAGILGLAVGMQDLLAEDEHRLAVAGLFPAHLAEQQGHTPVALQPGLV
jgi:hypothetical protein